MDEEPLSDQLTIGDNLLRDIFAGIAMHAILMNMANLKEGLGLAEESYRAADAMLARRRMGGAGEGAA